MIIQPDWPMPRNVYAGSTTREGGFSGNNYESLNLAYHTGDSQILVEANREKLKMALNLPNDFLWLNQTHGNRAVCAFNYEPNIEADACFSVVSHQICTVMTADCLPILLCHPKGNIVGAIHAGWKGLAANIIENTVTSMHTDPPVIMAWLGPAISQPYYEVGDEVRDQFLALDPSFAAAFKPSENQKWLADLYQIATQQLQAVGITKIYGGNYCTYSMKDKFFSARRDGRTGRMISFIYIR